MVSGRSFMAKREEMERKWLVVDAADKPLGRLATEVARVLMGKHKPTYTPHVDCGDFVVVVNASKVALTGRKAEQKRLTGIRGIPGICAPSRRGTCGRSSPSVWWSG